MIYNYNLMNNNNNNSILKMDFKMKKIKMNLA